MNERLPQEWEAALATPVPPLPPIRKVVGNVIHLNPDQPPPPKSRLRKVDVLIESGAVVTVVCVAVYFLGGDARAMVSASAGLSGGITIGRLLCNVLP